MSRIALTEHQWAFIRPLLPPPARTGRPRAIARRTLEGILYVLVTGRCWEALHREYGAPTAVWRLLKRWGEMGIWERIWRAALAHLDQAGQLDWSMAFLDGSFAPAKNGGEHVGLTRKGKGTKWMVVVERHGLPLGFLLASANRAEVRLAEQTLDTIGVRRPRGRPRRRPEKLGARIGDMIVARFDARCVGVGSGRAFRPSGGRQAGEPSADGPCSRTRTTIDSAIL